MGLLHNTAGCTKSCQNLTDKLLQLVWRSFCTIHALLSCFEPDSRQSQQDSFLMLVADISSHACWLCPSNGVDTACLQCRTDLLCFLLLLRSLECVRCRSMHLHLQHDKRYYGTHNVMVPLTPHRHAKHETWSCQTKSLYNTTETCLGTNPNEPVW